jgi:branched-chain amino acid transport system ATP-binding protein
MPDILEIDRISAAYGRIQALSDVSLKIPAGAIVALLGGNGAGKTTTLNTISRLVPLTAGSIRFEGQPIERLASHHVV